MIAAAEDPGRSSDGGRPAYDKALIDAVQEAQQIIIAAKADIQADLDKCDCQGRTRDAGKVRRV